MCIEMDGLQSTLLYLGGPAQKTSSSTHNGYDYPHFAGKEAKLRPVYPLLVLILVE